MKITVIYDIYFIKNKLEGLRVGLNMLHMLQSCYIFLKLTVTYVKIMLHRHVTYIIIALRILLKIEKICVSSNVMLHMLHMILKLQIRFRSNVTYVTKYISF